MDRRSSKPEVLTELRQRAVKLKKMGKTHREIAEILEIGELEALHPVSQAPCEDK